MILVIVHLRRFFLNFKYLNKTRVIYLFVGFWGFGVLVGDPQKYFDFAIMSTQKDPYRVCECRPDAPSQTPNNPPSHLGFFFLIVLAFAAQGFIL